uniref:Uncharacterized protein n=1 Tax=Lepeophtheirus salmonis TaxID=72036 RepID=A0A0K2USJ8_LEPSM
MTEDYICSGYQAFFRHLEAIIETKGGYING